MPNISPAANLSLRMLESGVESWRSATLGLTDYWATAVQRGTGPWGVMQDAARWLEHTAPREPPRWHSHNEVVLETPIARLRDFTAGEQTSASATLVLPPQAGHASCIVDYSEKQSQMQVIRAAGLKRAFTAEWLGATAETKDVTVDDYLAFVRRSVEHIGEPVNLIGDCQGGWLAAIYAALYPEDVRTLTIAGGPIDFHAGDAVIDDWVGYLAPGEDMSFYRALVDSGGGVLRGDQMLNAFITIKPESEVAKQMQLLTHLDDAEFLERHDAFETWYKYMQDLAGGFYLWIVEHLFARNALVAGELEIGGRRVDLGQIRCPVFLLAGARDHITPPAKVFATADHVGTAKRDIVRRTAPGGHLGLFMGSQALGNDWPPLLKAVASAGG